MSQRGFWAAICDRCGFRYRSDQLKEEWTGLMVCKDCWEPRHQQDLIRPHPGEKPLPWTRPYPTDITSYNTTVDGTGSTTVASLTVNCSQITEIPYSIQHFNDASTDFTILKGRVKGAPSLPTGVTLTVTCGLIVVDPSTGSETSYAAGDYTLTSTSWALPGEEKFVMTAGESSNFPAKKGYSTGESPNFGSLDSTTWDTSYTLTVVLRGVSTSDSNLTVTGTSLSTETLSYIRVYDPSTNTSTTYNQSDVDVYSGGSWTWLDTDFGFSSTGTYHIYLKRGS